MLLIPGLELRNGVCAYPNPAHDEDEPLIYLDPLATVQGFVHDGAKRIHLIDADGATQGEPVNTDLVQRLRHDFPHVNIEVTGGVRKIEHAELWLDVGAHFVVVGWKLLRNPETAGELCAEYPGRIVVALEGHNGQIQAGPQQMLEASALATRYSEEGVAAIFYTELHGPGEQSDPLPVAAALAKHCDIPVYCNGGIHALSEIERLKKAPLNKLSGVVLGRCLLNNELNYLEALRCLKK